jgi:hydroxyacylglutathione hydrolase
MPLPSPLRRIFRVDEYMDLRPYGIQGEILFTPGHTEGSQSVLIGSKLIAGDCFFNIRNSMVFPPFANDVERLLKSWQEIFDRGVDTIFPGHGPGFPVEKAKAVYERRMRKWG